MVRIVTLSHSLYHTQRSTLFSAIPHACQVSYKKLICQQNFYTLFCNSIEMAIKVIIRLSKIVLVKVTLFNI